MKMAQIDEQGLVHNIIIADEGFTLEGFTLVNVENIFVDIGDTLITSGDEIQVVPSVFEPVDEIELLKKQIEEQQKLIDAILGVTE